VYIVNKFFFNYSAPFPPTDTTDSTLEPAQESQTNGPITEPEPETNPDFQTNETTPEPEPETNPDFQTNGTTPEPEPEISFISTTSIPVVQSTYDTIVTGESDSSSFDEDDERCGTERIETCFMETMTRTEYLEHITSLAKFIQVPNITSADIAIMCG